MNTCDEIPTITNIKNFHKDMVTVGEVTTSKKGGEEDGEPILNTSPDRFGNTSETLNGRLSRIGFLPPLVYSSGLEFSPDDNMKTISRLDDNNSSSSIRYAPHPTQLPFTTSGDWGVDSGKFYVVSQDVLNDLTVPHYYDTVNDATSSDLALPLGKKIIISDYATGHKSGEMKFKVVAAGTGTPDGGEYIDLPLTSLQLKQELKVPYSVKYWGAAGDDVDNNEVNPLATDDTYAINKCFEIAFRDNVPHHVPAGVYKTTAPIIMWSATEFESKTSTLTGDGLATSIFKKYGNEKVSNGLQNHAQYNPDNMIDTVMMIKNSKMQAEGDLPFPFWTTSETACFNISVSKIGFSWAGVYTTPNVVQHSIYSAGWFRSTFTDIGINHTWSGLTTIVWNTYSSYIRVRMIRAMSGFWFQSPIGGNTTMYFNNCNMVGPNGWGMNVKGGGIIDGFIIDGGLAVHYKLQGGRWLFNQAYNESPLNRGCLDLDGVNFVSNNGSFLAGEDQTEGTAGTVFKAVNNSRVKINDASLGVLTDGVMSRAKLVDIDKSSTFILNDTEYDNDSFESPPLVPTSSNKKIIFDRFRTEAPYNSFVSYYYRGVVNPWPTGLEPVFTSQVLNNRLRLVNTAQDESVAAGKNAIMFQEGIDLTEYSRIRMTATITNSRNSNAVCIFGLGIAKELVPDGFDTYVGNVNYPTMMYDTAGGTGELQWIDKVDSEFSLDVSQLVGTYFIGVHLQATDAGLTLDIKDIALHR